MAGFPPTVARTRQAPSPASGFPAGELSRCGGSKLTSSSVLRLPAGCNGTGPAVGPVSANDGLPPTLGGW